MKKPVLFSLLLVFFFVVSTIFAAGTIGSQGKKKRHNGRHKDGYVGNLIHEMDIEGYHLSYRLTDLQVQMKNMQGMEQIPQRTSTHQLMLTIHDTDKKMVDPAQVGYLIVNPDGSEQEIMTIGTRGGYGSDINLSIPGEYTIKCKVAVGKQNLLDEFNFKIEPMPSD